MRPAYGQIGRRLLQTRIPRHPGFRCASTHPQSVAKSSPADAPDGKAFPLLLKAPEHWERGSRNGQQNMLIGLLLHTILLGFSALFTRSFAQARQTDEHGRWIRPRSSRELERMLAAPTRGRTDADDLIVLNLLMSDVVLSQAGPTLSETLSEAWADLAEIRNLHDLLGLLWTPNVLRTVLVASESHLALRRLTQCRAGDPVKRHAATADTLLALLERAVAVGDIGSQSWAARNVLLYARAAPGALSTLLLTRAAPKVPDEVGILYAFVRELPGDEVLFDRLARLVINPQVAEGLLASQVASIPPVFSQTAVVLPVPSRTASISSVSSKTASISSVSSKTASISSVSSKTASSSVSSKTASVSSVSSQTASSSVSSQTAAVPPCTRSPPPESPPLAASPPFASSPLPQSSASPTPELRLAQPEMSQQEAAPPHFQLPPTPLSEITCEMLIASHQHKLSAKTRAALMDSMDSQTHALLLEVIEHDVQEITAIVASGTPDRTLGCRAKALCRVLRDVVVHAVAEGHPLDQARLNRTMSMLIPLKTNTMIVSDLQEIVLCMLRSGLLCDGLLREVVRQFVCKRAFKPACTVVDEYVAQGADPVVLQRLDRWLVGSGHLATSAIGWERSKKKDPKMISARLRTLIRSIGPHSVAHLTEIISLVESMKLRNTHIWNRILDLSLRISENEYESKHTVATLLLQMESKGIKTDNKTHGILLNSKTLRSSISAAPSGRKGMYQVARVLETYKKALPQLEKPQRAISQGVLQNIVLRSFTRWFLEFSITEYAKLAREILFLDYDRVYEFYSQFKTDQEKTTVYLRVREPAFRLFIKGSVTRGDSELERELIAQMAREKKLVASKNKNLLGSDSTSTPQEVQVAAQVDQTKSP